MRIAPVLAVLAVLVVFATSMWFRRQDAPPVLPPDDSAAATIDDTTGFLVGAAVATTDAHRPDEALPDHDADGETLADRTEIAVDPAAVADQGLLVTVVRGRPPRPVVGIEVAWIVRDAALGHRAELRGDAAQDLDELDLPLRFGHRARTDERGELRLPPLDAVTLVAASDAGDFAGATVKPRQQQLRLVLQPDETLLLAAVDEQQRGRTGIPLSVYRATGPKPGDIETLWHGSSDGHGRAAVRHFQLTRPGQTKGERFAIAANVPYIDPSHAFAVFEARPAPREPVTLVLPALSPLLVSLHHRMGAPILAPVQVRLVPKHDQDSGWPVPPTFDRLVAAKALGEQPLLFAGAGPGLTLLPLVSVDGSRRPTALPVVTLPTAPDGPIPIDLVLPDSCIVLAMRLAAADDAPIAAPDVEYTLRQGASTLASGRVPTLADGRGDLVAVGEQRDGLRLVLRHTDVDGAVTGATLDLAALQQGERRDLGTVRLQPAPLIAQGTVRNDLGAAIADARIRVELQVPANRGDAWRAEPMLDTRTTTAGTFTIHGALPRGPFRLRAEAEGHFPQTTDLLPPGASLDLRLQRVGVCKGRLLLPDWVPPNAAIVTLQRSSQPGEQPGRPRQAPVRHPQGYFWIGNLEPGLYTASVTVRNVPLPMATFDGVRIDPGTNEDPRLSPLDLGTALFRYRLRAIGPGGRELAELDGPILWRTNRPTGEPLVAGFRWQKGKAELITPAPFLELTTLGRGIAPTTVQVAAGDHDVYLQPLQPFVVVLPGVRGAAGPTRAIRVSLIFTGDTGLPQGLSGQDQRSGEGFSFARWELSKSGGGWLDGFERTEIVLSRGGPHEVVLRIYEGYQQSGRQASIALGTVDVVVDGSQAQPTVLTVDPQKLAAALASLVPSAEAATPR